jgi:hypothetical protein
MGSSAPGTQRNRQIEMTDPEQVDAIDGSDGIGVLDAPGGLIWHTRWCARWR